jgi:hypothetical protein
MNCKHLTLTVQHWEKIVPTNLDLENLSANLRAHKDYTRAVISERDALQKQVQEQALQIISLIGQEFES